MIALFVVAAAAALLLFLPRALILRVLRRDPSPERSADRFLKKIEKSGHPEWAACIRDSISNADALAHRELFLESFDGVKLRARFYPAPDACGTILLSHGFHSFAAFDFGVSLPLYHALGWNMLLIDQRAHGESEGEYTTFGAAEQCDLCGWAGKIKELCGESHRYVIGGISMGCTAGLLAAAREDLPAGLCGVIADCGFTDVKAEFTHVIGTGPVPMPAFFLKLAEYWTKKYAGFGFLDHSALEAVKRIRVPVLFVHGLADDFVPPRFAQQLYDACASEKELVLVPKAGHGTSFLADRRRVEAALRRLLERAKTLDSE